MCMHRKLSLALLAAAMLAGGCGSQAQEQEQYKPPAPMDKSKAGLPEAGTAPGTKPAETSSAPIPPDKGKEKRANTPPGKTRADEAPLDGAIVDPAGVTTKK